MKEEEDDETAVKTTQKRAAISDGEAKWGTWRWMFSHLEIISRFVMEMGLEEILFTHIVRLRVP